jgi:hypothetical protein
MQIVSLAMIFIGAWIWRRGAKFARQGHAASHAAPAEANH